MLPRHAKGAGISDDAKETRAAAFGMGKFLRHRVRSVFVVVFPQQLRQHRNQTEILGVSQGKKQSNSEFSERTERLAVSLGVNLTALPEKIGVAPSVFFGARSGKVAISGKTWRKLERAEAEAARASGSVAVEETPQGYAQGRVLGDARAACEAYFRERVREAETSRNPHAWSHMLVQLRRALPPGIYSEPADVDLDRVNEIRKRLRGDAEPAAEDRARQKAVG